MKKALPTNPPHNIVKKLDLTLGHSRMLSKQHLDEKVHKKQHTLHTFKSLYTIPFECKYENASITQAT